jgi:hypothetical protein
MIEFILTTLDGQKLRGQNVCLQILPLMKTVASIANVC